MAWLKALFRRRLSAPTTTLVPSAPAPVAASGSTYVSADPPAGQYLRVWWVLDPDDPHNCCPDCVAVAARSPFDAPWVKHGNQLNQTPGDGQTRCGADCTCDLSYEPPPPRVIGPPQYRTPQDRAYHTLNLAQRTFVHQYGLNMTEAGLEHQLVAIVCADSTVLRADEDNDQYFTREGDYVTLWEDIAETSHDGWTTYHAWIPMREWPHLDVLWVLPEGILELMAQCWPQVPEYDEPSERELMNERRAENAAKSARDLEEYQGRRAERLAKKGAVN